MLPVAYALRACGMTRASRLLAAAGVLCEAVEGPLRNAFCMSGCFFYYYLGGRCVFVDGQTAVFVAMLGAGFGGLS